MLRITEENYPRIMGGSLTKFKTTVVLPEMEALNRSTVSEGLKINKGLSFSLSYRGK